METIQYKLVNIYTCSEKPSPEIPNFVLDGIYIDEREVYYTEISRNYVKNVEEIVVNSVKAESYCVELLETLVSAGFSGKKIKPRFHPYSRQQIELSNLPQLRYEKDPIVDIIFPPVGFEYLTKKYSKTLALNTEKGWSLKDRPTHVVNSVVDYNTTEEESVVFLVKTATKQFYMRWSEEYIEWLLEEEAIGYYRKCDDQWVNYSSTTDSIGGSVPMKQCTIKDNYENDLLINVDGVNMIVPREPMSFYEARGGKWCDRSGVVYGLTNLTGVWLCKNKGMEPIARRYCKPDSTQQIKNMNESVWYLSDFLSHFYLPSTAVELNTLQHIVLFGDYLNTIDTESFQIKARSSVVTTSRNEYTHVFLAQQSTYTERDLTLYLSKVGVIIHNMVYLPYRKRVGRIIIMKLGKSYYINTRNDRSRVYIGKNRFGIDVGWWYSITFKKKEKSKRDIEREYDDSSYDSDEQERVVELNHIRSADSY